MTELSIMAVEGAAGRAMGIRCRFINGWCRVDSHVAGKEGLLCEIGRNRPDIILLDMNLYAEIDGIETTEKIRTQFGVPVYYI